MEQIQRRTPERRRGGATVMKSPKLNSPPAMLKPAESGNVQVISGACVQTFALAGKQVQHARAALSAIQPVDPRAPALVNGRSVEPAHRLTAGDTLEFVHQAGEKGCLAWT